MRFALPLLSATLLPALLSAQPVIDQVDAPQEGDQFTYIPAQFTPIAETGENVTWDLSDIMGFSGQTIICEAPDATGFGDNYPTATVALDDGSNLTYLRADDTGLYIVGTSLHVGGQNLQIGYGDEELMLPYPCSYNTAYTDTFAYSYTFQGTTVLGGGSTAYTADGFGTLVLPYDTIHNVLKLTGTDSLVESIPGSAYLTVVHGVIFYKPGIHYYLLKASETTRFLNGTQTQTGSGIFYLSEDAFTGIHEASAEAIGIEAWPLPAHDVLHVSYGLAGDHQVDIDLFDATGRSVHSEQAHTTASGIQRAAINVQGLPAGIYLLQVSDDHGQRGTRRVVVQ